jgi:putative endonuclease
MSMFYTYIIYSPAFEVYYKGVTTNPEHRLYEHNNGLSRYTTGKEPWLLMYLKQHPSKREAQIEEKRLKKLNDRSLHKLFNDPNNIAPPLG